MWAKRNDPAVDALLAHGAELFLRGRRQDAAITFRRVLTLDPANQQALRYLDDLGVSPPEPPPEAMRADVQMPDAPVSIPHGPPSRPSRPPSRPSRPPPRPTIAPPRQVTPSPDPTEQLFRDANEAFERGDFTSALERCNRLLELKTNHAEAVALRDKASETLLLMYESELGGSEGVPELAAQQAEIIWLALDPRAGFVLSQVDGQVSYEDLYSICGMSRLETMRILAQLVSQKAIRTKGS